jgi:cation diffusion facilitator CzcD-associated flavoprotein CzcO
VLVVGGGNSGFQIAEELAATRQVDLSIAANAPVLPQRLAGKDLFWWLTRIGLMRVTAESRPGRRLRARPDFIIGSSRRRLRSAGVWQHSRGSALLGFVREDAAYLVRRITSHATASQSAAPARLPAAGVTRPGRTPPSSVMTMSRRPGRAAASWLPAARSGPARGGAEESGHRPPSALLRGKDRVIYAS